jgi:hypothetical protein
MALDYNPARTASSNVLKCQLAHSPPGMGAVYADASVPQAVRDFILQIELNPTVYRTGAHVPSPDCNPPFDWNHIDAKAASYSDFPSTWKAMFDPFQKQLVRACAGECPNIEVNPSSWQCSGYHVKIRRQPKKSARATAADPLVSPEWEQVLMQVVGPEVEFSFGSDGTASADDAVVNVGLPNEAGVDAFVFAVLTANSTLESLQITSFTAASDFDDDTSPSYSFAVTAPYVLGNSDIIHVCFRSCSFASKR